MKKILLAAVCTFSLGFMAYAVIGADYVAPGVYTGSRSCSPCAPAAPAPSRY